MHFFKAFSLLATAAFAVVAVAMPAVDTNAMIVKRQATTPESVPAILITMSKAVVALKTNIGEYQT